MVYTAVWWRTPGEVLTGQYISMVRVYNCALVDEQNNNKNQYDGDHKYKQQHINQ